MILEKIRSWTNSKFNYIYKLDKIKKVRKFLVRKVLREIYNIDDINSMDWSEMNNTEKDLIMENLYSRITEIEDNHQAMVFYMSTVPNRCDKFSNYEDPEMNCFKCENSGVVQKDQLIGWPW